MERVEARATPDAIVLAAMGMLGAVRALDGWLAAAGAERTRAALDPDDPALLAALGLVALRRAALRWLGEAAEPAVAEGTEPGCAPREILR